MSRKICYRQGIPSGLHERYPSIVAIFQIKACGTEGLHMQLFEIVLEIVHEALVVDVDAV